MDHFLNNGGDYDVACITEHWLTDKTQHKIVIPNYDVASCICRASSIHGGSLILLRSHTKSKPIDYINQLSIERQVEMAAVKLYESDLAIISLYRPPLGDVNIFLEQIDLALNFLIGLSINYIIVAGDYNINFLTSSNENQTLLSSSIVIICIKYSPSPLG